MLTQLVYVSNRPTGSSDQDIEQILASCQKNNPSLDITGVLLFTDRKFVQLVEGEFDKLNGLYEKIKADARHTQCRMISLRPIAERSFPSWHMGSRKVGNGTVDFKTDISLADRKVFHDILDGKETDGGRALGVLSKFL